MVVVSPAPVRAEQGHDLASGDVQIDPVGGRGGPRPALVPLVNPRNRMQPSMTCTLILGPRSG